jgi:hypothetical protein
VFKLDGYPGRFWNDELKNGYVHRLDGKVGARIRVMYKPNDQHRAIDGDAVKSYGLSIDGEQFASPEDAVNLDRALALGVLPLLGIGMLGLGYFVYRKALEKQSSASSA